MDEQQTSQGDTPQSGGGRDPLEQLKALLKRKEVTVPSALLILLVIGLVAFRGQRGPDVQPPTTDDPHAAIGQTVEGADSYNVTLTREFFWIDTVGGDQSASIQTEGVAHRDGSYDFSVSASITESGEVENMNTDIKADVRHKNGNTALTLREFMRIHAAGFVNIEKITEASEISVAGEWFAGSDAAIAEAAAPLGLSEGILPFGEAGLMYFEDEVVPLFTDLAEASELTSDTVQDGDRVRRYTIPQSVMTGQMAARIMDVLGTQPPQDIDSDAGPLIRQGQVSLWQDTETGYVHRIGFTTASTGSGLQVSVDYVLEDVGSAPAVTMPDAAHTADELRQLAQTVVRLSVPSTEAMQEADVRRLWLALQEHYAGTGEGYPTTENATRSAAQSVCGELIDAGQLRECPQDPKAGGFYGYRSDGQSFAVTALLEGPGCTYQPAPPPHCELDTDFYCEAVLAATSVTPTEDGFCLYELRGDPGQLAGF